MRPRGAPMARIRTACHPWGDGARSGTAWRARRKRKVLIFRFAIRLKEEPIPHRIRNLQPHFPDAAICRELSRCPFPVTGVGASVFQIVACPDFTRLQGRGAKGVVSLAIGEARRYSVLVER